MLFDSDSSENVIWLKSFQVANTCAYVLQELKKSVCLWFSWLFHSIFKLFSSYLQDVISYLERHLQNMDYTSPEPKILNKWMLFFLLEKMVNPESRVQIWLGRVIVGCLSRWRYQMRSRHELRGAGGGLEALFKQASIWSGPSGIRILDQDLGEKDVRIGPTLDTTHNTRPIKQQTDSGGTNLDWQAREKQIL